MAEQQRKPATYPPTVHASRLLWGEAYDRAGFRYPLSRVLLRDGREAWLVRGRTEVCRVLGDNSFSRAAANESPSDPESTFEARMRCSERLLINMDPPEHNRVRRTFDAALDAATNHIVPVLRARAADTLRAVAAAGSPCDLVPQVCVGYPSAVLCDLLGVDGEDRTRLHTLAIERYYQSGADPALVSASVEETYQIIERLLGEGNPSGGMIATLSATTTTVPIAESAANLLATLVAGHNNAASVIGNALAVLLSDTDAIQRLYSDSRGRKGIINEVLTAVPFQAMVFPRLATRDVELGGVLVRRGDILLPHLDSADSDREAENAPAGANNKCLNAATLIFGAGPHECPGRGLFIHMIEALLAAIVDNFPASLRLCSEISWRDIEDIHSAQRIVVDWRPRFANSKGDSR